MSTNRISLAIAGLLCGFLPGFIVAGRFCGGRNRGAVP